MMEKKMSYNYSYNIFNKKLLESLSSIHEKDTYATQNKDIIFQYIKAYPTTLQVSFENYYNERISRSGNHLRLGENGINILSEMFILKTSTTTLFTLPWLLLYWHSLILDDLLDESRKNFRDEILLSHLLLESSIQEFQKIFHADNHFYKKYRMDSIEAMIYEKLPKYNNSNNIFDYNKLLMQGQKSELFKYCAESMIYYEENRKLNKSEIKLLNSLLIGIQLLDDLTDIHEDYTNKQDTSSLLFTYDWIQKNTNLEVKNLSEEELIYFLIKSDSMKKTLENSREHLEYVLSSFKHKNGKLYSYFQNICYDCTSIIKELKKLYITQTFSKNKLVDIYNHSPKVKQ